MCVFCDIFGKYVLYTGAVSAPAQEIWNGRHVKVLCESWLQNLLWRRRYWFAVSPLAGTSLQTVFIDRTISDISEFARAYAASTYALLLRPLFRQLEGESLSTCYCNTKVKLTYSFDYWLYFKYILILKMLKINLDMLIFQNLFLDARFLNRDSSSTQNLTWHLEMVREWVRSHAHLTHWELTTVHSSLLVLLIRSWRPASRWQVDVPGLEGRVSSVCRHVRAQHVHRMLCLQMMF